MKPSMGLWMINKVASKLPLSVSQDTARELFSAHSMVFSNVPGPTENLYLCGQEVLGLQSVFFNAIPQFLLISYRERVWMNFVVDPDVITDPESFIECFFDELRDLGKDLESPLDLEIGAEAAVTCTESPSAAPLSIPKALLSYPLYVSPQNYPPEVCLF